MIRNYQTFAVKDIPKFKQQMLSWASRFNICCFMDNHSYPSPHTSAECLVGAGIVKSFEHTSAAQLSAFYETTRDWIFGHINYEFEPENAGITGPQNAVSGFPPMFFFVPEVVLILKNEQLTIGCFHQRQQEYFLEISACLLEPPRSYNVQMSPRMTRSAYLHVIEQLLQHIHRGDCYELNFCQQFYAENVQIDPVDVYRQLTQVSPNPFSAFYRLNGNYALCASPERYLKKQGNVLLSQPIKGTLPRKGGAVDDHQFAAELLASQKDRSENVMVVDLVRNDLSKVCEPGSVQVDELFGIYTFPQVYQMISSVSGRLKEGTPFSEILAATFPMGSMTGAPKVKVMELVRTYEPVPRGIYSGTIGYINPDKDFDFNVVIRSLVYAQDGTLSYHVGSGITASSIPENEYQECLDKAAAIATVLGAK